MPDLMEIIVPTCMSNIAFCAMVESLSDPDKIYKVLWGPEGPESPFQYGWSCDCRDFFFKHEKDPSIQHICKHIGQVITQDLRCAWNEDLSNGFESDDPNINVTMKCPDCNGPISYVRIAV